ncbi:MAG TPA: penicillin-binding protein [Oceanicaulis sp.]|uniref:Penicillin-binding protein 1A n=1 Tax=Glycocaulis albus TaxID=1382801 RepID=A0ABQ1XRD4_9PROT|nr:penicillin-binding protein 1A [Glycocaulis albus]MBV5257309.1 penicillin-binding protein 1A [Synechococcus moorigangaii CMS01]GGH01055.1 penicillin-binding protein 1A [Glycocaulis albus]HCY55224.1 penicillin-binding protein [Oceanicaulis sp.]
MAVFSVRNLGKLALWAGSTIAIIGIVALVSVSIYVVQVTQDLPDYEQLAEYEPPIMSRMHAGDGLLIAEYAFERRVFVPIEAIPPHVVEAFLAAEDANFYDHGGIDLTGLLRAAIANVGNMLNGRRLEGGSTITQQVAKNFLLSSEQRIARKVQEMVLAMRMERAFTKDRILELYLNEIFLGNRAYGVAAAALNYFDSSLDELELHEIAYLAALPKAPNNYHPERHPEAAIGRRNYVLARMHANGFITEAEMREAQAQPLETVSRLQGETYLAAEYFVEEVRRELFNMYGEEQLYSGGLSVRTSLNTRAQLAARSALRAGLVEYDRRYGYRGPLATLENFDAWPDQLAEIELPRDLDEGWTHAVVLEVRDNDVLIGMADRVRGTIPLSELRWARTPSRRSSDNFPVLGPAVQRPSDVLELGDVVLVERLSEEGEEYGLRQVPEINGAVMALDPYTGRVLAMIGGYSFQQSQFNRATQARRQPGSSFKPFVYAAALDNGFTPASIILDAPFAATGGGDNRFYRPSNYSDQFYGPSTMRLGLELSRNVMTVRLAQDTGMQPIAEYAERFGIYDRMDPVLSMSLGAGETTLWRLMSAYGALVNGGRRVTPTLIDRVQDRTGQTIYLHDQRECVACDAEEWRDGLAEPELAELGEEVVDPVTAYQVVSMLEGAVRRGTGSALNALGRPVAGKTGTTNEFRDAWFVGFTPDLVVGVYVGFDTPVPLGSGEAGGRAAAPIARDTFAPILEEYPVAPFRVPEGVRLVPIDARSGEPSVLGRAGVILEAFRPGTEPVRGASREEETLSFGSGRLREGERDDSETEEAAESLDGIY